MLIPGMPVTHRGSRGNVRSNDGTRYELIAERGDERRLLTYTRKTRRMLISCIWDRREALIDLFELTEDAENTIEGAGDRLVIGFTGGWHVRWSGRTEREAIQSGEYRTV